MLKKGLKWVGFVVGGILLYLIYVWIFPPTNLAYPIVIVGTDEEQVEMSPISVGWHDEVFDDFDSFDVVQGQAGIPDLTVAASEELSLTFENRSEESGVFDFVEMEIEAHTDAVFFSEKELFKNSFSDFDLDNAVTFNGPKKTGVYALMFELKVGEDWAHYAIRLFVE